MKSTILNTLIAFAILPIFNAPVVAADKQPASVPNKETNIDQKTLPDKQSAVAGKGADSSKPGPKEQQKKKAVKETPYVQAMKRGIMASRSGAYKVAETSFLRALAEAEKTGKQDKNFSATLAYLTTTYRAEGKIQDAEKMQLRCLEVTKKLGAADDPELARQEKSMALVYLHERKPNLAKPLLEHALKILEKAGPRYQVAYARTLNTQISMHLQNKDSKAAEATAQTVSAMTNKLPSFALTNYIWCITTPALVFYCEGKSKDAEKSLNEILKTSNADTNIRKSLPAAIAMLSSTFGDFAYAKEQFKKWEAAQKLKPDFPGIEKSIYMREAELEGAQGNTAEAQKLFKMASQEDSAKKSADKTAKKLTVKPADKSANKPASTPKRLLKNMFVQQADTLYSIALLDPLPAMYKRAAACDTALYGKNSIEKLPTLTGYEAYLRSIGDTKSADDCKVEIERLEKSNKQPVITTQSSKSAD